MSLFHIGKHNTCSQYLSDIHVEFKYMEIEKGTVFSVAEKKDKHLFFFLEGSVKVGYNEFSDREFHAGEVIFIPQSANCRGEALTKCSFIVHIYDAPVKLCDKVKLNSIIKHAEHLEYDFTSLSICPTLESYLQLLKTYLNDGIDCLHMHELKQKELFLLIRRYYEAEDIARLFKPMLGQSLDFRNKVMISYSEAKTVRKLADLCNYSEGHFNKLFVEEFKEPPYKWMQKQKSKHIIGSLAKSEVSLKEIVEKFGFSSQSHLNRYCKSQYGKTAAQIRGELLSNNESLRKQ